MPDLSANPASAPRQEKKQGRDRTLHDSKRPRVRGRGVTAKGSRPHEYQQESLNSDFVVGSRWSGAASKAIVAAGYANKAYKGVRVRAATANTVVIYVGPQGVSVSTGYPLPAGEEVAIPIEDPSKVNVVATPAANSQQTVTLAGQIAGDTFTLTLNGATTAPIAVNANAAAVQAALQMLNTIGNGNCSVTDTGGAPPYTVTFTGALAKVDVNLMTARDRRQREAERHDSDAFAGDKVILTFGATRPLNWHTIQLRPRFRPPCVRWPASGRQRERD